MIKNRILFLAKPDNFKMSRDLVARYNKLMEGKEKEFALVGYDHKIMSIKETKLGFYIIVEIKKAKKTGK